MEIKKAEDLRKNIVYISYDEIVNDSKYVIKNVFEGSFDTFIQKYNKIEKIQENEIIKLRTIFDEITLLKKIYTILSGYINTIFLEYSKQKGYKSFIFNRKYKITLSQKIKQKQNLISMIKKYNYKLSNDIWEKISISSQKFYEQMSINNFPHEIINDFLNKNDFLIQKKQKFLYFEYTNLVNGLNLNYNIDIVFNDLKEKILNQNKTYIIGVLELKDILLDINNAYNYIKQKLSSLSNEYLVNIKFKNGFYKEIETNKTEILPINKNGLTFLELILNNNILSENELSEIIYSRSKLFEEDKITFFEDEIEINSI